MKSRTAALTICCSSVHSITPQLWQALREMASCRDPQGRSEEFCVSFRVKDRVVYPHHGAAIIEATEKRATPEGEDKDFFVLRMTHGDLVLKVPVDKAEEIGMRYPISVEDVEDVFEVLAKKDVREPTNWSRRFKNHQEKLKSGDVYQVAEVVRNLALRDNDKGLSAGEKSMFVKARQVLVSELAFALDISEDDAMDRLAKTIA
jgi:CarD family transcriptional regulator